MFEAEDFGAEFTPELREARRAPARANGRDEVARCREKASYAKLRSMNQGDAHVQSTW